MRLKKLEKIQLKIDGYIIVDIDSKNYENNKYYIYNEEKQKRKKEKSYK